MSPDLAVTPAPGYLRGLGHVRGATAGVHEAEARHHEHHDRQEREWGAGSAGHRRHSEQAGNPPIAAQSRSWHTIINNRRPTVIARKGTVPVIPQADEGITSTVPVIPQADGGDHLGEGGVAMPVG
jgi:hypothetical protein